MKKYPFLITISVLFIITQLSCSKEMSQENNGSQPPPGTCDYAPYTVGSTFSYININNTNDTTHFTFTVSGDTTINGIVYKKMGNDSVFTCSNCASGEYTQIASILTFQGYEANDLQLTYLKDNVVAGTSWKDTITVNNGSVSSTGILEFTITATGMTKSVNGEDYTDVIAVRTDAYALVSDNTIPVGTLFTSYYGKGIGLIEMDKEEDTTRLVSYDLQP
ncbi:hypothetical protein ACDQ55_03985 [Chitinophaga sp. 30R24]|uniref:hypothetical protein n=1 Tax=Chitinophaga sp. 30R24 TaxID=3248838 RepID=UPI003B916208